MKKAKTETQTKETHMSTVTEEIEAPSIVAPSIEAPKELLDALFKVEEAEGKLTNSKLILAKNVINFAQKSTDSEVTIKAQLHSAVAKIKDVPADEIHGKSATGRSAYTLLSELRAIAFPKYDKNAFRDGTPVPEMRNAARNVLLDLIEAKDEKKKHVYTYLDVLDKARAKAPREKGAKSGNGGGNGEDETPDTLQTLSVEVEKFIKYIAKRAEKAEIDGASIATAFIEGAKLEFGV